MFASIILSMEGINGFNIYKKIYSNGSNVKRFLDELCPFSRTWFIHEWITNGYYHTVNEFLFYNIDIDIIKYHIEEWLKFTTDSAVISTGLSQLLYYRILQLIESERGFEIIQYMFQHGADVNGLYRPPVFRILSVDSFIQYAQCNQEFNINATDCFGNTFLMHALKRIPSKKRLSSMNRQRLEDSKYYEMIETILGMGAKVNIKNRFGQTALMLAVQHGQHKHRHHYIICEMLNEGADVNCVDDSGRSALFYASCEDCRSILVKYEAGTEISDIYGVLPIVHHYFSKNAPYYDHCWYEEPNDRYIFNKIPSELNFNENYFNKYHPFVLRCRLHSANNKFIRRGYYEREKINEQNLLLEVIGKFDHVDECVFREAFKLAYVIKEKRLCVELCEKFIVKMGYLPFDVYSNLMKVIDLKGVSLLIYNSISECFCQPNYIRLPQSGKIIELLACNENVELEKLCVEPLECLCIQKMKILPEDFPFSDIFEKHFKLHTIKSAISLFL